MTNLLEKIHKGMKVLDQEAHEIGTVDFVKFGEEDPDKPGVEAAGVDPLDDTQPSLAVTLMDVFRPDEIPDELRDRLIREGFVRMEAPGLFHADRYVLPEQIQAVNEDEVRLNVSKSELIKRS
jgi:hypothetical protein